MVFLTCVYLWPSDRFFAITIWPPFVWAGLSIILLLFSVRKNRTRLLWTAVICWLAFWLFLGEEKWWFRRFASTPTADIQVVSLNCAGGTPAAAAEAFAARPDIVLLQESPSQREIQRVSSVGGRSQMSVLSGPDASIVTSGHLEPIELPKGTSNFVAAKVTVTGNGPVLVVSLRLQPPIFDMTFWNPDCWRSYAENRARRRAELAGIVLWIRAHAGDLPIIVGGDFNTPPDSGTFAGLSEIAQCATYDSGYTAVNEFPLARIDQVWTRGFTPKGSRAIQTINSDHRMVRVWMSLP